MNISNENRAKYLYAPTFEQIEEFRKMLKLSRPVFERFYGIPLETIKQVKKGKMNLPAKYWHIIYEKISPQVYSIHFKPKSQLPSKGIKKRVDTTLQNTSNTILNALEKLKQG